ncbi:MAG: outer membrane lipoprotein-sorting protein [Bacteroidota bacterium]
MKRFLLITATALFTSLFANSQTLDQIISNNIKAMGGAENWAAVKSIRMNGSMELMPEMKAPVTMLVKDKTKFRFELEFQGMKMIQALDGESGWSVVPFSGKTDPERMSEEDVRSAQESADIAPELFDYKSKGKEVELLGKEDMEGTDSYKLKITKKNGDISYLYVDAQSFLVIKETSRQKFQDKEVEAVSIPSDYRMVGGVMFPFSLEMRGDDEESQGQSMTFDSIEVNPKIDDSVFAFPNASEGK